MENTDDLPIQDVLAGKHSKLLSEIRPLISRLNADNAKLVLEALVENPIQDTVYLRDKNAIKVHARAVELRNMLFQLASYDNIKTMAENIEPATEINGE
jgi:hypothetical protein